MLSEQAGRIRLDTPLSIEDLADSDMSFGSGTPPTDISPDVGDGVSIWYGESLMNNSDPSVVSGTSSGSEDSSRGAEMIKIPELEDASKGMRAFTSGYSS
ncbi:hypothetical protein PC123_g3833 [Phytophthora cactorum]|nr:hypothetical protein PC123_g3833 [Phytophthora cactorum]